MTVSSGFVVQAGIPSLLRSFVAYCAAGSQVANLGVHTSTVSSGLLFIVNSLGVCSRSSGVDRELAA